MFRNYFKLAWRNLLKRKATSLINILGLTLGFACAVLIYLFVSFHLSYDDFHENDDRIYRFVTDEVTDDIEYEIAVPPGFAHTIRNDFAFTEKVGRYVNRPEELITIKEGGKVLKFKEDMAFAEKEFFEIFNFPLQRGNIEDFKQANTALITPEMAKKLFGNEDPLGKELTIDSKETFRIVGLLKPIPKNTFLDKQLFASFASLKPYSEFAASDGYNGITSSLQTYGLLLPGQDPSAIEKQLEPLPAKYRPHQKNKHHYRLQLLKDKHLDGRYAGGISANVLWIVSLIGFFVLLIACINFINIATAQSAFRFKEVGVRKVLGGQKKELLLQFLTEMILLTTISLILGLAIAFLALPFFNELVDLQLSFSSLFKVKSVVLALVALLLVSLLAGLYPGIVLGRVKPIMALKNRLSPKDTGGVLTRKILVTTQFAISIGLIVATLVISKQLNYSINSDLGFDTSVVMVDIPEDIEPIKFNSMKDRLLASPAIESISACYASPGASVNDWGTSVVYDHRPEMEEFHVQMKMADKDYLKTFGLKLIAGRNFFEKKDTVDEVLVNRAFAEKLSVKNPEDLINKEISLSGKYFQGRIVGVVENFHDVGFESAINPVAILPQMEYGSLALKLNNQEVTTALTAIEKEWTAAFPNSIYDYKFLDERVADMYTAEKQFLSLGKVFSILAIIIGCLGIYGLISFFVIQKTKEIGIRKILGGSLTDILSLFTRDFLIMIGIAGLIAVPVTFLLMRQWLQNYVYRTSIDIWIFVAAIAIVLIITMAIIIYKGVKAILSNPIKSLRTE
ncbi:MAG: hypothetical protein CL868_11155 [Cytophagaceae bacterium]|nr:hypothetical protein [Cytophagaceae bacterium]|tara:strand:+ start:2635 stop:5016 length:2382 start_codon:yes stop_codon:yes gene_type:complete